MNPIALRRARPLLLCLLAAFCLILPSALSRAVPMLAALALGLLLLRAARAIDEAAPERLFPTGAFRAATELGRGMWVIALMICAAQVVSTFLALAVGRVIGLGPTAVGYVAIAGPLVWSAIAVPAGTAGALGQRRLIRWGPAVAAGGMALTGLGLALAALPLVLLGEGFRGLGFGLAWGATHARIIAAARPGEADRAAGILPAMVTGGEAVGAGLGGALAAGLGLVAGLETGTAGAALLVQWGMAAALAVLAAVVAHRLGQPGAPGP